MASGSLSRPASHPQPAYLLLIESHATGRPGGPCSLHLCEETGWESNLGFSSPCCPRRARSCEGGLSKTGTSTLASPQCLHSLKTVKTGAAATGVGSTAFPSVQKKTPRVREDQRTVQVSEKPHINHKYIHLFRMSGSWFLESSLPGVSPLWLCGSGALLMNPRAPESIVANCGLNSTFTI